MEKRETKQFRSKTELILYFLKGSKRFFGAGLIFACLLALLDLINPRIIGFTVDSVIGTDEPQLPQFVLNMLGKLGGREYLVSHLYMIAIIVIVIALIGGLCRYLFQVLNSMGAEKLVQSMRESLYGHIQKLPYSWHGENQTGDIIQRCTSDVETIKRFLAEQLITLVRVCLLLVLAISFMWQLHRKLTMIAVLSIPVVILYSFFFHDRIGSAFQRVDEEEGRLSTIAQENLTGVRVVRAFGRELYERDRFMTKNEEYTKMWIYMMKLLSIFWASNDLISGLQIMLVTGCGAYFCVNGSMSAGQYISFIAYNAMLTWPVRMLGRVISEMSKAGISVGRIQYIMNAEAEQDKENTETASYTGDICFEHVSFDYGNSGKKVLDDVSFTIPGGKTVGILGGTGAGKSTLVHLLDRLYELPENGGKITISGKSVADLKSREIRKHVGLVLQEPYLFSRTLDENIRIGAEGTDHEDVKAAAKIACLDQTIEHFTDGYETYVGERGVTLSGGQKQRTAIAQMLIRKPEIMIFDDSLSAVDSETDGKIRAAIKEYTDKATVILISHRITTLMHADQIIVLDKGRVAEIGTHKELIEQQGIYRKIYDLQMQQM
ncbi:MAG: ABC transporter ATP-binding protein [Clostridiales bacterium]|nr:ABC transporter ATP-binding protein [Candidatus Blautia equi]